MPTAPGAAGVRAWELSVLEATLVVHVIRPFARRRTAEIVAAPKVYGFDTGFVCNHRGWHGLRREDLGLLWEQPANVTLRGCRAPQTAHAVGAR